MSTPGNSENTTENANLEVASFGIGCFWCGEAVFARLDGVARVTSGFQGGHVENPTYKEVCRGDTGHAEVIRVEYDPDAIRYEELLDVFWRMHDPTQADGQGHDIGPQYRSAIFTYTEAQKAAAEASKRDLEARGVFNKPIVTEITEATTFYPAEDRHQDYFENNREAPYCRLVIVPKLQKLGLEE